LIPGFLGTQKLEGTSSSARHTNGTRHHANMLDCLTFGETKADRGSVVTLAAADSWRAREAERSSIRRSNRNSEAAATESFLGDFGRGRWAAWARDVEIQHVAWRHSKMLLGGNVALSCGNARMPESDGKLFDGCVAFMG
jgi:hypothetical protein